MPFRIQNFLLPCDALAHLSTLRAHGGVRRRDRRRVSVFLHGSRDCGKEVMRRYGPLPSSLVAVAGFPVTLSCPMDACC